MKNHLFPEFLSDLCHGFPPFACYFGGGSGDGSSSAPPPPVAPPPPPAPSKATMLARDKIQAQTARKGRRSTMLTGQLPDMMDERKSMLGSPLK